MDESPNRPSVEINQQTALNAERYGFDLAFSMIRLRGRRHAIEASGPTLLLSAAAQCRLEPD